MVDLRYLCADIAAQMLNKCQFTTIVTRLTLVVNEHHGTNSE